LLLIKWAQLAVEIRQNDLCRPSRIQGNREWLVSLGLSSQLEKDVWIGLSLKAALTEYPCAITKLETRLIILFLDYLILKIIFKK
jgi:hypothetical protein